MPRTSAGAQVTVRDLAMSADTIGLDLAAEEVTASGHVIFTRAEMQFGAARALYRFRERSGVLEEVQGCKAPFRYSAARLTLDADNFTKAENVTLTTCQRAHPHYQLLAKELSLTPDHRFEVRHAGLAVRGHQLFSYSRIRGKLASDDQQAEIAMPSITGGSSQIDGLYVATNLDYTLSPTTALAVTGRLGTNGVVRGGLTVAREVRLPTPLTRGTLSLVATTREDVKNRLLDSDERIDARLENLTIDRMPALQLDVPEVTLPKLIAGCHLKTGVSVGRYRETPTRIDATRGQAWGILRSPNIPVGSARLWSEVGVRSAIYEGSMHHTYVTQVSFESPRDRKVYYQLSYLHRGSEGSTPFIFDRVLMPDEFFSQIEVPLTKSGRLALNLGTRYDLQRHEVRDRTLTAIVREDCISYGLIYNQAERSYSLGVILNDFGSFRRGVSDIGFTQ